MSIATMRDAPSSVLLYDPLFLEHNPGRGHPERPERIASVVSAMNPLPAGARMRAPARPATEEELTRVHTPEYVASILAQSGKSGMLDPDTVISPRSVDAARLAAGACLELVEEVIEGRAQSGFALVRPPGHHAEADKAMGFCLFNNVAVGAAAAIAKGLTRVLVIDWDVHHGNGTQAIFYSRPDVLFFSTHQYPFYPGTGALGEAGEGAGAGYTVNVPLSEGLGDADYMLAFQEVLLPAADAYKPEIVLVSAGFDPHIGDPLAAMRVTPKGFGAMCGVAQDIAEKWSSGRLVLTLEGGYDLAALAKSARICAEVLGGAPPPKVTEPPSAQGKKDVEAAASARRSFCSAKGAPEP
jgi:acetoin utilization deacetylase AcuC-like enzyme